MGIDNESKGARVYWLDSKTVTVERNIYYDNSLVSHLEEEQEPVGLTKVVAKVDPPVVQTKDNPDESTVDSDANTLTK